MPEYIWTQDDIAVLREMAREFKGRRTPGRAPTISRGLPTAPEVYIARTPAAGIPALNEGPLTGTGTIALGDDVPGEADCAIYRILDVGTAGPEFLPIPSLTKTVYNLSGTMIAGDTWITVIRDKFGNWLAQVGGAAGLGSIYVDYVTCVSLVTVT